MVATANAPETTKVSSDAIVDIRDLTKIYSLMWGREIEAVSHLSLSIKKGETLAIVGPNGSGKTTTLKIILGMLFPTEGEVEIFGSTPGDPEVQKRIGYLPEAPYFYEYLNGREMLEFFGRLSGVPEDVLKTRIEDLLHQVDLHERGADLPIRVYSRGMRQRIGIAQAMINEPDLLILDEPTNGLDPLGTVQVRQFILEQKRRKRTLLLCSHLLSEVEAVADRVAILHRGKLITVGPVSELVPESQKWQVIATGISTDGKAALQKAGLNAEVQGGVMTIRVDSVDEVYQALGTIRDSGGELVEVTRPQPTLEAQFLKAVGEEELRRAVDGLQKETKK